MSNPSGNFSNTCEQHVFILALLYYFFFIVAKKHDKCSVFLFSAATAGSSSTNMGGMPASTKSVSMSRYSSCRSIESGLSGTASAPKRALKSGKELLSARGKKNKHKA